MSYMSYSCIIYVMIQRFWERQQCGDYPLRLYSINATYVPLISKSGLSYLRTYGTLFLFHDVILTNLRQLTQARLMPYENCTFLHTE